MTAVHSAARSAEAVPTAAPEFEAWMEHELLAVEQALESWVPIDAPAGLGEAMRYGVLDGGKRLRPLLVLAACQAVDGSRAAALRAAVAVELIHAYSLVHDDMPCMDNDVLRRGKPTVHVRYGEAQAMLAGDAMQALAFEVLTPDDGVEPALQARLCALLARSAGHAGMAGGQAIDLASIGRPLDERSLMDMHRRKTGALLQASVLMGAACGAPDAKAWAALADLRRGHRPGLPGGGRHSRRHAGIAHAGQDGGQGPACQQADLCVGARPGRGAALRRATARQGADGVAALRPGWRRDAVAAGRPGGGAGLLTSPAAPSPRPFGGRHLRAGRAGTRG